MNESDIGCRSEWAAGVAAECAAAVAPAMHNTTTVNQARTRYFILFSPMALLTGTARSRAINLGSPDARTFIRSSGSASADLERYRAQKVDSRRKSASPQCVSLRLNAMKRTNLSGRCQASVNVIDAFQRFKG